MGCLGFWEGMVRYLSWLFLFPAALGRRITDIICTYVCCDVVHSCGLPVMKTGCQARTHAWVYFAWLMLLNDLPVTKAKERHRVRRNNGINVQLDLAMICGQGFGVWEAKSCGREVALQAWFLNHSNSYW